MSAHNNSSVWEDCLVPEAKGIKKKSSAVTCFKLFLSTAPKKSVCVEERGDRERRAAFSLQEAKRGRRMRRLGDKIFATDTKGVMK